MKTTTCIDRPSCGSFCPGCTYDYEVMHGEYRVSDGKRWYYFGEIDFEWYFDKDWDN